MVLVTTNKQRKLLFLNYVGQVVPEDLAAIRPDLETLLAEMPPDFRLLGDMSLLEYMGPECTGEIGRTMEIVAEHGVGLIIRVIPDPSKDIGLNILTAFHYPHRPRVINCQTLVEALEKLEQWS